MKKKLHLSIPIITAVLLFVSAAAMYAVHRYVPFMMDDLWYATLLSEDTPITSPGDIVQSQIWHYYNWGGRSITHGLLQLILLAGEGAADILNVAAAFLLCFVTALAAGVRFSGAGEKKFLLYSLFGGIAMLLGLNANWKMSMFWQAGAANYLYITVFLLLYLFCYLRELPEGGLGKNAAGKRTVGLDVSGKKTESREPSRLAGIVFWIVPLGVAAGWSNENMGPAVWIASLIVIYLVKKAGRKIRLWMILGNISCLFGSAAMIAAPGNFVRSAQVAENSRGILWQVFLRCYAQCKGALEFLFPVLLVLGAALLVAKALGIAVGRGNRLLLFTALLSWGAMVLSPHYPDRASFGTMALLICVIVSLAEKILRQRKDMELALFAFSLLIWLRGMYFLGEFLAINWGWI